MVSTSRILFAFFCAGMIIVAGVIASGAIQALMHGDDGYFAIALLTPLFGLPFFIAALLVSGVVYIVAKSLNMVSRSLAIATGIIFGAVIGLIIRMPLLPVWSACLIGAAAGNVWWSVARDALPSPPAT